MAIDFDGSRTPGRPDWDDPWWDPPARRPNRLRKWWAGRPRYLAVVVSLALLSGIGAGGRWLYEARTGRPGGIPALVSHRPALPGCGRYRDRWGMTVPPATYRPGPRVLAANRCLLSAFADGRSAELIVTGGPDDIGHRTVTFYRVVARHVTVIWEDIPPTGPINAGELSGCAALSDDNGLIDAADCRPVQPSWG